MYFITEERNILNFINNNILIESYEINNLTQYCRSANQVFPGHFQDWPRWHSSKMFALKLRDTLGNIFYQELYLFLFPVHISVFLYHFLCTN